MIPDALPRLLETGYRILDSLRQSDDSDENGVMAQLMSHVYTLGRVLSASPELLSGAAVQDLLKEATRVLQGRHSDLSFYPLTVLLKFEGSWEDDEWIQLCIARSGIEFFIALFRDTTVSEEVASLKTNDLDELIRDRENEGHMSDDEIPPEIPTSHWWWWYPEEPRNRPRKIE